MKSAILDSDTLSYFLKGNSIVVSKVDAYLQSHGFVHLSIITYYEILNGLFFKDARSQLARFQQFVQLNQVLPITLPIASVGAQIFADLRKNNQIIGHNDVLIGSTAIEHDLVLVTNNTNHFSRIPGILLDNWVV